MNNNNCNSIKTEILLRRRLMAQCVILKRNEIKSSSTLTCDLRRPLQLTSIEYTMNALSSLLHKNVFRSLENKNLK